ncbi:MAG: oligosaccharide flippase family protein [Candidatus Andersenbacteria bacterium]
MDLARTQFFSLTTKAVTTVLGVIQSIIIVRVLSPAEFGLVGLVMSIGSVIGVSQHLGIVDGAIREIAIRKKKDEIGKVFWVSNIVRQAVTLPLSLGLMALAGVIAVKVYNKPEIIPYIYLFAASLVLQGFQDVFGATLTGMKKFAALYWVQIITATLNVAAFGYLTWRFSVSGFFWAVILTTTVMVVMFWWLLRKYLAGNLSLPNKADIKKYGRNVMRIGAFMYVARIFFVVWQRLPILALGGIVTVEELGYLNVSSTFGSKLTIIAMALSEVNLAWMSSLYESERKEFSKNVTKNMHRVLVLMMLMTLVLLFFTPEILRYIIGPQYLPAEPIIWLMTLAFFLYALLDIGTSSIFVPANDPKRRMSIYGVMLATTAVLTVWILFVKPDPLLASAAMLAGAAISYVWMNVVAKRLHGIALLTKPLAVLLTLLFASVWWLFQEPSLVYRIIGFILIGVYTGYEAHRSQLIPTKVARLLKRQKGAETTSDQWNVVCFAGAEYLQPTWTNRQHVMHRVAKQHRVLYVEPRVWILRYLLKRLAKPAELLQFAKQVLWYQQHEQNLYVISQWNLIPGSREYRWVALLNHYLNRWCVLSKAWWLGFREGTQVMWIYDTEAAEYLNAFSNSTVIYDCVDNHAMQAGVSRNPKRVHAEEHRIFQHSDLVTVTSKALYDMKKGQHKNVRLVLNAGDVELFSKPVSATAQQGALEALQDIPHPIIGSVGALDAYKFDFELLKSVARAHPDWQFVFVGSPVVDERTPALTELVKLPNVHIMGTIVREDVPAYVHYFDVCVIPYRASAYNKASFPLKFWEFMATGKPLVVSGLPELKQYEDLIGYAHSSREFERLIEEWMRHETLGEIKRKELARQHGWDARVGQLLALIRDTLRS